MNLIQRTRLVAIVALSGAATLPQAAMAGSLNLVDPLVGHWRGTVTILSDCSGSGVPVFSFPAGQLIQLGGTLQTTDYQDNPDRSGPGFGYWHHEGHRKYFEKFQFVRYNPDGTVAGYQRVTKHVVVGGRNTKNAEIVSEALDINGNLLGTNCATEVATRFQ